MSFKMKGLSPFKKGYKPPTIEYGKLPPGALGRYMAGEGKIILSEKYNNPMISPELLKEKQDTIKHETKHHHQYYTMGEEAYTKKYRQQHIGALEEHMDVTHTKPKHEISPEVKTAREYQNINPALEQITADRYSDWWKRRGQYITSGTMEHEAEEAIKKESPGLFRIQRNTRRKRRR